METDFKISFLFEDKLLFESTIISHNILSFKNMYPMKFTHVLYGRLLKLKNC